MNEAGEQTKQRNKQIAENESARQTVSAVRVSTWAVALAVVLGLVAYAWSRHG